MIITIGHRTKESMKILNIQSYPFTENELKEKYKKLSKMYHPDITKGDDSLMKKINEAYSHLKNLALSSTEVEEKKLEEMERDEQEKNMFDFTKTCPVCWGKKHLKKVINVHCACVEKRLQQIPSFIERHLFLLALDAGIATTSKTVPCNAPGCKYGKFTLKNGKIINCRKCKGTGIFIIKCKICSGIGIEKREDKYTCPECNGKGFIGLKVYNPVIPKGAILGG